ncbi:MAG: nuclear transport factor 2 family protein [Solirubrobacterales bacterium]|nr:nuclear transport factor 2 family protein [Solirubrobacterales bacterium]
MTDVTTLVEDYLATWNETDATARRALVSRVFAADADYLDPQMAGAGTDGIDTMIAGVQQRFPGLKLTLAAGPDTHNDRVRFSWHLAPHGGEPVALGIDFATLTPDGRMQSVTGFLEAPGA